MRRVRVAFSKPVTFRFRSSVWASSARTSAVTRRSGVTVVLIIAVILTVVAIVVMIAVAHVLGFVVQHQPHDVSAHTLKRCQRGTHEIAVSLSRQGDKDYAVYRAADICRGSGKPSG